MTDVFVLDNRFWSKVEKTDNCWVWISTRNKVGYGRFYVKGRGKMAHRLSYGKEVPEGLELDHLCFNRACVNPEHLEAVTRQENARRRTLRNRCWRGHNLTPDNVYVSFRKSIGQLKRQCKTCYWLWRNKDQLNAEGK